MINFLSIPGCICASACSFKSTQLRHAPQRSIKWVPYFRQSRQPDLADRREKQLHLLFQEVPAAAIKAAAAPVLAPNKPLLSP